MSAHALDSDGDNLYNDKARFTNLEETTSPLPQNKEDDLRNLLHHVRIILTHTTPSMSQSKEIAKATEKTESLGRVSKTMRDYANNIGQQIVVEDGKDDREKTWRLVETDPEIPLETKAVLSLVAFATMYGRRRLSAQMAESNHQLAKSVTLLKGDAKVGGAGRDELNKYWLEISTAIKNCIEVADQVLNLPNNSARQKPILLSTAVFRIINMVVLCWSQVGNILIKRSRMDIVKSNWSITENERYLKNKSREIEEEVGKEKTRRQAEADHHREVNNRVELDQSKKEKNMGSERSSLNCWWKLRQMLHPTTSHVKSRRRPSMLLCTANHTLSHTHTISSTSQGALPMDKEAAESSSSG